MNIYIVKVVLLLASMMALTGRMADAIKITDCGSTDGTVTSIVVDGCGSGDDYCPVKIGRNISIDINFDAKTYNRAVMVKIQGVVGGSVIDYPFPHKDACKDWGLTCPLVKSSHYHIKLEIPTDLGYPVMKEHIRVTLVGQSKILICQEIPIDVTK